MNGQLDSLVKNYITRKYLPKSVILYQGEAPREAQIIVSGVVRAYNISAQGEEQTVTYHIAGEFLPVDWVFKKAHGSIFFYETVSECNICMIPREKLLSYMFSTPDRKDALIDYFATNYAASLIRVSGLEQPKAQEKLLFTLYYLCQRYGEKKGDFIEIKLSLTHQNLASLVGLTRETTTNEMNKLKKQKLLTYDNQKYVVDLEKLLDLIGEDSFRGISISA
jgi:CRP/FNR family transcriptional regulator, cyclic AMP receptor protein